MLLLLAVLAVLAVLAMLAQPGMTNTVHETGICANIKEYAHTHSHR